MSEHGRHLDAGASLADVARVICDLAELGFQLDEGLIAPDGLQYAAEVVCEPIMPSASSCTLEELQSSCQTGCRRTSLPHPRGGQQPRLAAASAAGGTPSASGASQGGR